MQRVGQTLKPLMEPTTLSPTSFPGSLAPTNYSPEFWKHYYETVETSDETPVESEFQEKQMRLLAASLNAYWKGPGGDRPFLLFSDVGLFHSPQEPPVVPDIMLILDVHRIPPSEGKKSTAYFQWEYGKPPDLVMEIVSNRKGEEDTRKLKLYERLEVPYYVIHDPNNELKQGTLRIMQFVGGRYEVQSHSWLNGIGIGLTLWTGHFEKSQQTWLRWMERDGKLVPTPEEEGERANRLAAKLKSLGIDPENI